MNAKPLSRILKTRFLSFLAFFIFFFSHCGLLFAHRDTFIQLEGKTLTHLPEAYSPAELDLKDFQMRVKDHVIKFTPLLKSLFDYPYDLKITASWYHQRSNLAPYIVLHIQPQKKDFSYELSFELESLELTSLSIVLQVSESATQYLPIELSKEDKPTINKAIKTIPE